MKLSIEDFQPNLHSLCAGTLSSIHRDPAACAEMIEALAKALGFTISMATGGDKNGIETFVIAANDYVMDEAVRLSGLAGLMSSTRTGNLKRTIK